MLNAELKRDLVPVVTLALEVLETWEGTKKQKDTDTTLSELAACLKYCGKAMSDEEDWEARLTRSLDIDDGGIDFDEAMAIADVRNIVADKSRREAITSFLSK